MAIVGPQIYINGTLDPDALDVEINSEHGLLVRYPRRRVVTYVADRIEKQGPAIYLHNAHPYGGLVQIEVGTNYPRQPDAPVWWRVVPYPGSKE